MVCRLPCNWKRTNDGDLIETVEYAPVEPMHHAGCRGEVRVCWLVPRGVTSFGNRRGVMSMMSLFNTLPPVVSSLSMLLPASLRRQK